jgi:hypothetical protein
MRAINYPLYSNLRCAFQIFVTSMQRRLKLVRARFLYPLRLWPWSSFRVRGRRRSSRNTERLRSRQHFTDSVPGPGVLSFQFDVEAARARKHGTRQYIRARAPHFPRQNDHLNVGPLSKGWRLPSACRSRPSLSKEMSSNRILDQSDRILTLLGTSLRIPRAQFELT